MRLAPSLLLLLLIGCGDSTGPSLPPPVTPTLALGSRHACRATDSATWCWGRGVEGQLGREDRVEAAPPGLVVGAPAFRALAAGEAHSCGLDAGGGVWCWGLNSDGQLGVGAAALDDCEGRPCTSAPMAVAGLAGVTAIAAGGTTTCALDGDGQAWCWGRNDLYQLGTTASPDQCGFYPCSRLPVPVTGDVRLRTISVSGADHACGLTRAGEAWCWGFSRQGQLGHDTLMDRSLPVRVHGGIRFRQIAAGGLHTCGVDRDALAWCWGIDAVGAGGFPIETHVPVRVTGGHRFREAASARFTSCGLATDGRAWCWGPNAFGEIGAEPVGAPVRFDTPAAVSDGRRFVALAPGAFTYCALDGDGSTWCWGEGRNGELGRAGLARSTVPVRVEGP